MIILFICQHESHSKKLHSQSPIEISTKYHKNVPNQELW